MTTNRVLLLAVDAKAVSGSSSVKRYRLAKRPVAGMTAAKGLPRQNKRGSD